jgi:UDP-N-acetylmuramate--alanine ligase
VAEADESDGSFLKLSPTIAVVTNIDPEHLDHYGSHEAIKTPSWSSPSACPSTASRCCASTTPTCRRSSRASTAAHVTYGTNPQADYVASDPRFQGTTTSFGVCAGARTSGASTVRVPGRHNVLNCLATIAVADELDIPLDTTRDALASFEGVQRRFTIVGEAEGSPTSTTTATTPPRSRPRSRRQGGLSRRVVAAFQPHRYSRTRDLFEEFTRAFNLADHLVVTEVYAAGERPSRAPRASASPTPSAHGHRHVVRARQAQGGRALERPRDPPGDMVIALGARATSTSAPLIVALAIISALVPPAAVVTVPLKFVVSSLVIAWDLLDYPFGLRAMGVRARLGWMRENLGAVLLFGASTGALLLIPLLGLFVLPCGVVAATELVVRVERGATSR